MNKTKNNKAEDNLYNFLAMIFKPFEEIYKGIREDNIPTVSILLSVMGLNAVVFLNLDTWIFNQHEVFKVFDLFKTKWRIGYVVILSFLPLFLWSVYRSVIWAKIKKMLEVAFVESGIKSPSGRLPQFISDDKIDDHTRRLKLYKNKISLAVFHKNEQAFAESLGFHIDEVKEKRASEIIEITYSLKSLPKMVGYNRVDVTQKDKILIGKSRGGIKTFNFDTDPHLLVAGQSGNGKSTFLRQAITTLYLNNKNIQFILIDLKQGLEFQLFERLPRVKVIDSHAKALAEIKHILEKDLPNRMSLLRANNVKDITEFNHLSEKKNVDGTEYAGGNLPRKILVIDEAAQLYFVSRGSSGKEASEARDCTNRLVATGRAVGLNIIICTQRPDRFSVDPITKANLTAKLCFRLPNQASSRVVLDSNRANELPEIKGRAIFQEGNGHHEVQVPYLSISEAEELLGKYKSEVKEKTLDGNKPKKNDESIKIFNFDPD